MAIIYYRLLLKVWTMVIIYIVIACGAVLLVCLAVDRLPKNLRAKKGVTKQEFLNLALDTLKHVRRPTQLILIPITVYSGLEQGFRGADFNAVSICIPWSVSNGYLK